MLVRHWRLGLAFFVGLLRARIYLLSWGVFVFAKFGCRFRMVGTRRGLVVLERHWRLGLAFFVGLLRAHILNQISRFVEHLLVFGGQLGGRATGSGFWRLRNLEVLVCGGRGRATGGGSVRLQNWLVLGQFFF